MKKPMVYDADSYESAIMTVAEATEATGQPCVTMIAEHSQTGQNAILCFLPSNFAEAVLWTAFGPDDDRQPDVIIFYPKEVNDENLN